MKLFDQRVHRKAISEAKAYAAAGGQALHVWDPGPGGWPRAPAVFQRTRPWAHLFDQDLDRLVATAKRLGVKVIKPGRVGGPGQHIDLCGAPLKKAMAESGGEG
jgi:hypothetical protein